MIHEITMLLVKFRNDGKSLGMVKDRKELARQIDALYKDCVRLDKNIASKLCDAIDDNCEASYSGTVVGVSEAVDQILKVISGE